MLFKKPFFLFLLGFAVVMATLQVVAIHFSLYWTTMWFDIMMHFLGGLWFGLMISWLLFFSGYFLPRSTVAFRSFLFTAVICSLVIGIFWEIFEYCTGLTFVVAGYMVDTSQDLVLDVVGGAAAALVAYRVYKKN